MSICNLMVGADAVWLLSDTMTYEDGKPVALTQRKAEVAPNEAFIWSCRGSVGLGNILDECVATAQEIDEAERIATVAIERIPADLMELGGRVEITIAGWSGLRGAMRVVRLYRSAKDGFTATMFEPGVHLAPGASKLPAMPAVVSEAQFVKLALAQWKISERFGLAGCVGGVMHLSTVTCHGAEQRIVGLYPDYAQHAAEFGDPNAEEVARFLAAGRVAA